MPIKKKKISELTLANSLKGLYTIGYTLMDGVKISVRVGLEYIQTVYDKLLKVIDEAEKTIVTMRQLETTVETNEQTRQTAEEHRKTTEQNRQAAEAERNIQESKRIVAENSRANVESHRTTAESDRIAAEIFRQDTENTRVSAENERVLNELSRVNAEANRVVEFSLIKQNVETATGNATHAAIRLNTLADHRDEIRDGYWWRWNEETEEWYNTSEIAKGNIMYAGFEINPETGMLTMSTDSEYTGANFHLENGILTMTL